MIKCRSTKKFIEIETSCNVIKQHSYATFIKCHYTTPIVNHTIVVKCHYTFTFGYAPALALLASAARASRHSTFRIIVIQCQPPFHLPHHRHPKPCCYTIIIVKNEIVVKCHLTVTIRFTPTLALLATAAAAILLHQIM
jgi:hypothetical protein